MPRQRATRRRLAPEDRRRAILEAASSVFMRYGYAGATTDLIAGAAGISVGTVYLYFRNKQDILLEMYREGRTAIYDALRRARSSARDPLGSLEAMGRAYVAYARANPGFIDVREHFQQGTVFRSVPKKRFDEVMQEIRDLGRATLALIEECIVDGQKKGILDPSIRPHHGALLCWVTTSGALRIAANPELTETAEIPPEELVETSLRFVLEGLRPRARRPLPRRVK